MEDTEPIEESKEDIPTLEIAEEAHAKVDALLELLVEKGIISEEEFEKKFDEYFED